MIRSLRECGWFALDKFGEWNRALEMARLMRGKFLGAKVHALEYGEVSPWSIIANLQDLGYQVWIDDKQSDIPSIVGSVVASLARGGADLVSVYADESTETIGAAVAAYRGVSIEECVRRIPGLGIVAISILTSTPPSSASITYRRTIEARVVEVAKLASAVGAYGIVCSAQEARAVKDAYPEFPSFTPGIRSKGAAKGDHYRTGTLSAAVRNGSRYPVIGTEITRAANPLAEYERLENEIASVP